MSAEQIAALDTLAILAAALLVFCVGAWFGWESRSAKYRSEHVERRG